MQIHLLVVSDNDDSIAGLTSLLRGAPVRITCANDAQEAMSLIKECKVKIAIVDFDMVSSEKLISGIRICNPLCCVIAVTNKPDMTKIVAAIDIGAWDYIARPLREPLFIRNCVRYAISRVRRWESGMLYSQKDARVNEY